MEGLWLENWDGYLDGEAVRLEGKKASGDGHLDDLRAGRQKICLPSLALNCLGSQLKFGHLADTGPKTIKKPT